MNDSIIIMACLKNCECENLATDKRNKMAEEAKLDEVREEVKAATKQIRIGKRVELDIMRLKFYKNFAHIHTHTHTHPRTHHENIDKMIHRKSVAKLRFEIKDSIMNDILDPSYDQF